VYYAEVSCVSKLLVPPRELKCEEAEGAKFTKEFLNWAWGYCERHTIWGKVFCMLSNYEKYLILHVPPPSLAPSHNPTVRFLLKAQNHFLNFPSILTNLLIPSIKLQIISVEWALLFRTNVATHSYSFMGIIYILRYYLHALQFSIYKFAESHNLEFAQFIFSPCISKKIKKGSG